MLLFCLVMPVHAADNVEVVINGIEGRLATNVRAFLSMGDDNEKTLSVRRIRQKTATAPDAIRSALQPYGYYSPNIEYELDCADSACTVLFTIDKGPATHITKLVIKATGEGRNHPEIKAAIAQSNLEQGQQLLHRDYKSTKSALTQAAYSAGYLEADYAKAAMRVYPAQTEAKIWLVLNTGPQYYFGDITINQDILAPSFVNKYVNFERGDVFNSNLITNLQLTLSNTGYFSQIEIRANRHNAITKSENANPPLPRVPVTINAEPRKSRKYSVSVGYGTDTGPRVGAGVVLRRLNRQGHQFRANIRISAVEKALNARYIIPVDQVATDKVLLSSEIKEAEYGDANSFIYRAGVARQDVWEWGRARVYTKIQRERFGFGSGKRTTSRLLYYGVSLGYQSVANPLRVRDGYSFGVDIHGGFDGPFATVNFLQTTFETNLVYSPFEDVRLLARGKVGATATDDFSELPPSQRFYTGGARSVRGYGYDEISPENADGDDIGGKYLAQASFAVEYLFYKDMGAAVFFDVGDAALNISGLEPQRGVGIGYRWLSPVGTLRLDFAYPLDDPTPGIRIHFSLGADL